MASYAFNHDTNQIQKVDDVKIDIKQQEKQIETRPASTKPFCGCLKRFFDCGTSNQNSFTRAIKILVLGPGGSGKSTVLKQMRVIHGEKFRKIEQERFKIPVISNIFQSICDLVDAMYNIFHLKFEIENNNKYYDEILIAKTNLLNNLEDWNLNKNNYVIYIKSIWNDKSIQECYENRNKFYLHDSAKYFIDSIDRISSVEYIPNLQDILRVREPTTAIIEHKYRIQDTDFLFVDVGGQRSERRKWISCFESVENIMFVSSLSDYDLNLTKDELRGTQGNANNQNVNRLKEALDLFQTTINWKKRVYHTIKDLNGKESQRIKREELLFKNVGIVLFLNKKDLFEEKILKSPLKICFNDFNDDLYPRNNRAEIAKRFIASKFTEHVEQDRNFYCHFTYALDRDSMEVVIQAVKDRIIEDMLKNLML